MAAQPNLQNLTQAAQQIGQGFQTMANKIPQLNNLPIIAGHQAILDAIADLGAQIRIM